MIVWAWRCRHSRGFGVQSPWAYSFIRYVVNEHYPYYAYKQLESKVKAVSGPERRLCQLYFRMANYLQPRSVVDFGSPFEPFRAYVSAGCRRASDYTFLAGGCINFMNAPFPTSTNFCYYYDPENSSAIQVGLAQSGTVGVNTLAEVLKKVF